LVQEIKTRRGLDVIANDNEVTLLSKTFEAMIREEDQLFNSIEKSKKYLRENYLICLLRGKTPGDDEQIDLFPYKYFVCGIITIDRYEDFVANFSYEQQFYLKSVILNLSEETIGSSFKCSGIAMEGGRIVLIINFDNEDSNLVFSMLKNSFTVIQNESTKVIETTITVCLSTIYNNIHKVRIAYYEAQHLLKLRFMSGYGNIICNIDKNDCIRKYYYPFSLEKQILNNVDTSCKSALLVSLNDLITELKENKELSYDNVMLILNQLLGNTVKYLLNQNLSVSKIFGSDFNIYSRLADIETLDEAGLFLSNIFLQIIEYNEKLRDDGKSHIAKIMEYIQKNYKKDIAVNDLADHVGLSYSHVRKIFNDETGENIVNYINNMRIEEAQRLLRQSNLNINDIALSLGYNNKQSFNRFFKKYVGINPGEYRNIKTH
jgi:AraC-like DNA-binding protein